MAKVSIQSVLKQRKCLLLFLTPLCIAAVFGCPQCFAKEPQPNILLIVIDALRADHLGIYGYERNTSPNIDAFAKKNVLFSYAVAPATWTAPSVASLFTGFYPVTHRVNKHVKLESKHRPRASILANKFQTLAERLKEAQYQTYGITANAWVADYLGFAQGFDTFVTIDYSPAKRVNQEAFNALRALKKKSKPFFLYLHYMDPHHPYRPPKSFRKIFEKPLKSWNYDQASLSELNHYDGEIRYLDSQLGILFKHLKKSGLYENLVIALLADHGEQFGEFGKKRHGRSVYNVEAHVPLMLRVPGKHGRIDTTVSLLDIYPTLLELAHVRLSYPVAGFSLFNRERIGTRQGVVTQAFVPDVKGSSTGENHRAYISVEGKKLILAFRGHFVQSIAENRKARIVGLFDGRRDPFEQRPIDNTAMVRQMQQSLYQFYKQTSTLPQLQKAKQVDLKEKTIEQLRSLGYLR